MGKNIENKNKHFYFQRLQLLTSLGVTLLDLSS